MQPAPAVDELVAGAVASFERRFGRPPRFAAAAPGRVNLIGEHTDYNDGFVLPMAIERWTVVVADRAERSIVVSESVGESCTFDSLEPGEPHWANYIKGVVAGFPGDIGPFEAVIDSTVPLGGGLSSSAAVEVATATVLEQIVGSTLDPVDKALLCQRAEHEYAGMPCGIMDQFIVTMGRAGHAMLIDCRTREPRHVPMNDPDITVLVINSNVRHELSASEYPVRRAQCEQAAKALGARALRDVTMEQVDPVVYPRAVHVVGENARTLQAADEIAAGHWASVGRLMNESHASLRDQFEVSCEELDLLVDLAGAREGVYGSRMTGGGFGGCTVSLVQSAMVDEIAQAVCAAYRQRTGIDAEAFSTRPADGARVLSLLDRGG